MTNTTIIFDSKGFVNNLHSSIKNQVPRAVASTLNKVAKTAMYDLRTAEQKELHLTRDFLPNATQYEAARTFQVLDMYSEVGILNRVKFADLLIDGGDRTPTKSKYVAVPEAEEIKKKRRNKLKNVKHTFTRNINGTKGVWQNVKADGRWKIRLLAVLDNPTVYDKEPYLKYHETIDETLKTISYEDLLAKALLKAIGK